MKLKAQEARALFGVNCHSSNKWYCSGCGHWCPRSYSDLYLVRIKSSVLEETKSVFSSLLKWFLLFSWKTSSNITRWKTCWITLTVMWHFVPGPENAKNTGRRFIFFLNFCYFICNHIASGLKKIISALGNKDQYLKFHR